MTSLVLSGKELRNRIITSLESQGFAFNPHLRPKKSEKDTLRRIHKQKKFEQLKFHKNFLNENFKKMREYSVSGCDIKPEEIKLRLIPVQAESKEAEIFLWWNLVWWSLPYTGAIGRSMRFLLWDDYHDAPFGLLGLQSPPLRSKVRDDYLGISGKSVDYWINQSMYAQRLGALPPYNELIGAKMVALAMISNEVRQYYRNRYTKYTILENRRIPSRLLFLTTTSAFGKSSVYERLSYGGEAISQFMGFTSGLGTFHVPEETLSRITRISQRQGLRH